MTGCSTSFSDAQFETWYSHSLSHYGNSGPPSHAICIFCSKVFDSNDPLICWRNRMNHIAGHFESGCAIESSRPEFGVIRDMREKGVITEADYKYCMEYTERPQCNSLRPHDYVPKEIKEKHQAAYYRENRVVIPERSHKASRQRKSYKRRKQEGDINARCR